MKKTFLAMLLAGSSMMVFAQNTQTGSSNQQTNNTTQATMSNTSSNNANWSGSTSWAPETSPYWGWSSYEVWYGRPSANNMSTNPGMNSTNNMASSGSLNSSSNYAAYGVAVPYLPANVQMRFNQDFPSGVNNTYSWNQYGDWFHTYNLGNGRLTQYFYDARGNGYSLALPVIATYVPENIIEKALNKYGSNLYSVAMIKTADGNDAYQVGLIRGGQMTTQYLDENGASVQEVWRTDDMNNSGSMNTTQSNAAMDNTSSMSNSNYNSTDANSNSADVKLKQKDGETKWKVKNADGSKTKIKIEDGKTKIKTDPASNNQ